MCPSEGDKVTSALSIRINSSIPPSIAISSTEEACPQILSGLFTWRMSFLSPEVYMDDG